MQRTYSHRLENLVKQNDGQMNAKVRKYANVKQVQTQWSKLKYVDKQSLMQKPKLLPMNMQWSRTQKHALLSRRLKPKQK